MTSQSLSWKYKDMPIFRFRSRLPARCVQEIARQGFRVVSVDEQGVIDIVHTFLSKRFRIH